MPKFTPGPWIIDKMSEETIIYIRDAERRRIAGVTMDFPMGPIKQDANANLIAAAPDLRESNQNIVDRLNYYINNPSAWDHYDDKISEIIRAVVDMAESALKKADGEVSNG